jgi:hypothetical protein
MLPPDDQSVSQEMRPLQECDTERRSSMSIFIDAASNRYQHHRTAASISMFCPKHPFQGPQSSSRPFYSPEKQVNVRRIEDSCDFWWNTGEILPLPLLDPRPTSDWRRRRRWPMMKRSSTGLKGQPAKPPEQARHSVQAKKVHQPPCSGLIAGLQIRFAKTTQFYSSSTRFLCCNDMNPSNARLPVHTMRMAPAIMKASRFWANRGIVRSAGVSRGTK